MAELDNHSTFVASREVALAALKAFVPRAGQQYTKQRNDDLGQGNHQQVSRLSPYLTHRILTEPEVIGHVLDFHELKAAQKFIDEVCWRSYWKGWLQMRPAIWKRYCNDVAQLWDGRANEGYIQATTGRSGIPCMDDWSQELIETGYLHNHSRMWFASIWIFTLGLPWQLGADFFLRHLLDGDAASNTLSWRWVAGLHTRGKHYLARPSNIEKFTAGRYASAALPLNVDAKPLDPDSVPEPINLKPPPNRPDRGRIGWLICEHDLSLGRYPMTPAPNAIAALNLTAGKANGQVSQQVIDFAQTGLDDALNQATQSTGAGDSEMLIDPAAVGAWARARGLQTLEAAFAPIGHAAEQVGRIQQRLAKHEVRLIQIMHPWDRQTWPHATSGFFKFNRAVQRRLPQLMHECSLRR